MPNITTNHAITYTNTEGQNYWNNVPENLRNQKSYGRIKKMIKKYILKYSITYSKNSINR